MPSVRDVIQWDLVNWNRCLTLWMPHLRSEERLKCLELGARGGGLSLLAASLGHEVYCTDINGDFTAAKNLHQKYFGKETTIHYREMDATDIPFANEFDLVFLKSVLNNVGRNDRLNMQQRCVSEIHKCLKPDGKLLYAENVSASRLHMFARKKFVRWGESVRYASLREMKKMLQPFSRHDYSLIGFMGAFGRNEWQRSVLGTCDRITDRLLPDTWKYIMTGVAQK